MSIEKLKKNYPVRIRWIAFPLHPETPAQGMSMQEMFAGRDITPMKNRLQQLMAEAGLAYGDRTHSYNSRLAQELGKWADTQIGGEAIHDALFQAYLVDNVNISEVDELVKIAGSVGLEKNEARRIIESREFETQVDADWQRSRALGVTGVPTFYSDALVVVGCQPYETLEKFVQHLMQLPNQHQHSA